MRQQLLDGAVTVIGLDFQNQHVDLFSVQLVDTSRRAVCSVHFMDGRAETLMYTPQLAHRKRAILRWGQLHYFRARGVSSSTENDPQLLESPVEPLGAKESPASESRRAVCCYPTWDAARLVMACMQPLVNRQLRITTVQLSDADKLRGVGEYAITTAEPHAATQAHRLSMAADTALQLALADALREHDPQHPLLKIWSLRPQNRSRLYRHVLSRDSRHYG